jgi:hypothetical protein
MARLLGREAWNRSRLCKRINCCNRPRWTYGSVRLREERQWEDDYWTETEPDTPEWVERSYEYIRGRII